MYKVTASNHTIQDDTRRITINGTPDSTGLKQQKFRSGATTQFFLIFISMTRPMPHPTELTTPRLILKSVTPTLIHACFNTKTKEEIISFFGVDEDGYAHLKNMHEKGMETHRLSLFYFLLIEKDSNQVLGECGFHTWNASHNRAELFYSMRNDSAKRKGFMTEALSEVLDFGFRELKLHRIEALIADSNTPSKKLLQRYGFTKEGTMREDYVVDGKNEDSDCYSLLKWEWK